MAEITFLGSCREIGRSGFLVQNGGETLLVDYGVKFQDPPLFPDKVPVDELQGIAVTHAHLDHSGGLPRILLEDPDLSLFCTPATRDLTVILLRDMYNLSRGRLPFDRTDITRVRRQCVSTTYEETVPLGHSFDMTLFNAGHIPGSAMVSVRVDGKRVLFTGDFNALESQLMPGARNNLPRHDIVVTESTYARRTNPPREEIEADLIATIEDTMKRGGVVLIPAFAVGRSQEIMCILERYGVTKKYPVYIDGMARDVNTILMRHPGYVMSPHLFERAVNRIHVVESHKDRVRAVKNGGVIISPAGMLKGGAAHTYFKMVHDNERNSIVLVSFQISGTPGAELLARRKVTVGRRTFDVDAEVYYHHLSSHSDSEGLLKHLLSIPGDPVFYVVHGESESCDALAEQLHERGRRAIVPETNDTFDI